MNELQLVPRYHALDGVRAFAMLLGVFLHSSIPYIQVPFFWPIVDDSRSVGLTLVIFVIHTFRMPAFFLIAGFFARLVFHRIGMRAFVRRRAKRVLLPFVVGWLLLYPLVRFLGVWSAVRAFPGAELWPVVKLAFAPPFLGFGMGLIHLWFLYYLALLYLFGLTGRWLLFRNSEGGNRRRERVCALFESLMRSRFAVLGLALPTACGLMLMRGWGVDFVDRSIFPRVAHLVFFGLFFVSGWLLHRNPNLLSVLRARWLMHIIIGTLMLWPEIAFLHLVYVVKHDSGLGFRFAYFLIYAVIAWCFVLGLIGIFQRFFDNPSRAWRYLADASYWIYLAHLPLVIALPVFLRELAASWHVKLAVVLAASIPLLVGSYHLLVRYTWIGAFLNGRRMPTTRPDARA